MKFFAIVIGMMFSLVQVTVAQDPMFSQSYAASLYLSPSFTGFTNGSRVATSYRNQWPGIGNAFRTYSLSYDQYLEKYRSGLGVLLMRDDRGAGLLVTQNLGFLYSYEIQINKQWFVRPGVQFKYSERKLDAEKLIYFDNIGGDGSLIPGGLPSFDREAYQVFDATASGMIYSDKLWFGFTLDHLVKNKVSFSDYETYVPMHLQLYGGYKYIYKKGYRNSDEQSLSLVGSYVKQSSFNQFDAGVYWYLNPIEVGLIYRGIPINNSAGYSNSDALVLIMGINVGALRFAYSYDMTINDLSGYSNGSNEISLIYRFNQKIKKNQKRGPIPCEQPGVNPGSPSNSRKSFRKFF